MVLTSENRGRFDVDQAFGNWRTAAIGLGLTIIVIGGGLALAFL